MTFDNPTAFHTVIAFLGGKEGEQYPGFSELVVKPFATATYVVPRLVSEHIYLSYMDDTGAARPLVYECVQGQCALAELLKEK